MGAMEFSTSLFRLWCVPEPFIVTERRNHFVFVHNKLKFIQFNQIQYDGTRKSINGIISNCSLQVWSGNESQTKRIMTPDPNHRRVAHARKPIHSACRWRVRRTETVDRAHPSLIWTLTLHQTRRHQRTWALKRMIRRRHRLRQSRLWTRCGMQRAREMVRPADSCLIIKHHSLWAQWPRNDRQSTYCWGKLLRLLFTHIDNWIESPFPQSLSDTAKKWSGKFASEISWRCLASHGSNAFWRGCNAFGRHAVVVATVSNEISVLAVSFACSI